MDVLVNCAGITSVDACEQNQRSATKVNVTGNYNLHEVYGKRVLTISSDHIFPGITPEGETANFSPVNHYGWTKVGAEAISQIQQGRIIRLSRSVSIEDTDISRWIMSLYKNEEIYVPSFFTRNYLTRSQVVDGIEYFVNHFDLMPRVVNYGSIDTVSMLLFMKLVATEFKLNPNLVKENSEYNSNMTPRPLNGGFRTELAQSIGFPMYYAWDAAEQLAEDANA